MGVTQYTPDAFSFSVIGEIFGKLSFEDQALVENFKAIYSTIAKARPAAVKGTYIKNLVLSTTMGPGIHVSVEK